jgi:dihydroorotate dehydrogenase (fumarate)
MNLSTNYLGLQLENPLVAGASPLTADVDTVRALEDYGAGAVVLNSAFAERVGTEGGPLWTELFWEYADRSAASRVPDDVRHARDAYLNHVYRCKEVTGIPIIASVNASSPGAWLDFLPRIHQAGADALELNVYVVGADPHETGEAVEARVVETVHLAAKATGLPLAVKISPFFSSLAHFAHRLTDAGADGLVLFNRFYQPDIDIETCDVSNAPRLSSPTELLLRLRWTALLARQVSCDLAITGGVHTATDAIKSIMAGAGVVQIVSALIQRGPSHLRTVLDDMRRWMQCNDYRTFAQLKSRLALDRGDNPGQGERAAYVTTLGSRVVGH